MDFKETLKDYQDIVNKELEKYLRKYDCPEKQINESMEYSLMAGGKRLRPILIIDTYKLFKNDYEKAFPFAVALEMVHNFSLIHDDLPEIDNDDIRHGKPTNHKRFNHATALLAGDSLFNQAYSVISADIAYDIEKNDFESVTRKGKAFAEFTIAVDRMIAGEYLDTELEGQSITKETLEYIHQNKTGALLKLAVRIGAILAGADDKSLEKLTTFAEKIGLAFQIKDDILSEEGDEKITGKPVGNDKELNKCTYVSFYGLDRAKEELEKITKEALEEINDFDDKADFLRELALYIKNRNK